MNVSTRKILNNLLGTLQARRSELESLSERDSADFDSAKALAGAVSDVLTELQEVRDEEQAKFDNMPESLQDGDRGQRMQEGIDALDAAESSLEDGIAALENDAADPSLQACIATLENGAPEIDGESLETFRDAIATALSEFEDADSSISDAINA